MRRSSRAQRRAIEYRSETEIEDMISDAEAHADDDRRQRELAEARNVAENAAYSSEKQLEELGDQVSDDDRELITAAIKDVREAVEASDDVELINSKAEALQSAFHQVSEKVYQAAQASQADGSTNGDGTPSDDEEEVIEAEVVDEDESK